MSITTGTSIPDGSAQFIVRGYPAGVKQIEEGGTGARDAETACQNLGAIGYRKLDSVHSIKGSFWADSSSGIRLADIPAEYSGYDWSFLQMATTNGVDKTQLFFNAGDILIRGDDAVFGSETWNQQSWKKLTTSYIVTFYRSGYNWYRIWSNGMIEQGGTFGGSTSNWASTTFSFLKAFSNNSYLLFLQGNWSTGSSSSCKITSRSTSSATVTYANNLYSTYPNVYYACGY